MCSRRSHGSAALVAVAAAPVLLALAGGQRALAAQQTEEDLVRHLHELLPRLDSARVAATAARDRADAREAFRSVASVDTLQVGPLRILTPPDEHRVAEGFFRDVWESDYAAFVASSPSLERTSFTFQWTEDPGHIPVGGAVRTVALPAWRPASAVRAAVEAAISTALAEDLPVAVAAWGGGEVRDWSRVAGDVFREVTIVPSRSNRACLEGDIGACWTSLGLDLDDTPLDEWYTPEERRARVGAMGTLPDARSTWLACVRQGSTPACDAYLARWPLPRPIADPAGRRAMLWIALRAGGTGAWARLRADTSATTGEALSNASGLTSQELATRWRAWLIDGAPRSRAVLDPNLLIYLMWIVVLAAFATRSTRWRLH